MNPLALPATRKTTQEFFTARELAELAQRIGYKGFPHTKSGAVRYIDRQGWNTRPPAECRKRSSVGGGLEYHISLVPDLQGLLVVQRRFETNRDALNALPAVIAPTPAPVEERADDPTKRAIAAMHARAEIVVAILAKASRDGQTLGKAVTAFLKAQDDHQLLVDIHAAQERGDILTNGHRVKLHEGSALERQDAFWISEATLSAAHGRPRKEAGFKKVSRATIYEWLKSYDQGGVAALTPERTKQVEDIPLSFWTFMREYAKPAKPAITRAHAKYVEVSNSEPLSLYQVKRILRRKVDHIERNKGREGALALRSRMAFVQRDTSDMLPTLAYTGDGHTFDAEIADPSGRKAMRPEMTSIIDVHTRKCTGWAVSRKENVIAVTEALRNACVVEGIPAVFYVDRGAGYKNRVFDDDTAGLMARLAITKMHALPYGSQAKGEIERSHKTIWIPFAKEFPTYLGEDMDKEARQKAFKQSRKDLKEFGHSRLLMPWEEFIGRCQDVVDRYNATPSSALPKFVDPATGRIRHMSPNDAWAAHVENGFEPILVDPMDVDDLFRPYVKRKVSRNLVEWNTNTYFSLDLTAWHEQWVFVGYDDAQADRVWVRQIDRSTGEPGRLICVAAFGGNKVAWAPRTYLAKAAEDREKGALKRLDRKRRDIEAERTTPYLIDATPVEPAPFLDATPPRELVPAAPLGNEQSSDAVVQMPRRRVFATDADLAVWALDHAHELSANQIRVLRSCVNSPAHCDLFRMSGIDVEALRTLLRAVA